MRVMDVEDLIRLVTFLDRQGGATRPELMAGLRVSRATMARWLAGARRARVRVEWDHKARKYRVADFGILDRRAIRATHVGAQRHGNHSETNKR
jgi:hypothetical protein